jgi:lipid-A-disaccharide synthase-like uncharacterized protein
MSHRLLKEITRSLILQLNKIQDKSLSKVHIIATIWSDSRFVKRLAKITAAAIITIVIFIVSWLRLQHRQSSVMESIGYFSLLSQACAAEQALFQQDGIIHILNEITVYPTSANVFAQNMD